MLLQKRAAPLVGWVGFQISSMLGLGFFGLRVQVGEGKGWVQHNNFLGFRDP